MPCQYRGPLIIDNLFDFIEINRLLEQRLQGSKEVTPSFPYLIPGVIYEVIGSPLKISGMVIFFCDPLKQQSKNAIRIVFFFQWGRSLYHFLN
ncbi:MAG: hypothetical protein WA017_18415 [Desulfosalsimonadaceae bacterium]